MVSTLRQSPRLEKSLKHLSEACSARVAFEKIEDLLPNFDCIKDSGFDLDNCCVKILRFGNEFFRQSVFNTRDPKYPGHSFKVFRTLSEKVYELLLSTGHLAFKLLLAQEKD